ncbi:MAG: helix-turn-helix transcriptional regulator [Propionibacteriaceae bacterium]|nr:helix-turn-helix transcriptional regulator [Propionibacteriaceae bacterium]
MEASGVLAQARSTRQLTMNALSDVSGVPVSTISRIEAGRVEPTWAMMGRLLAAAGFRLDAELTETGSDDPFASVLRSLSEAQPSGRAGILRRFPTVARLAPVARRTGARRVELSDELGGAVISLARQGRAPVVSSLEAYLGDPNHTRSFSPVVYVDDPVLVTRFNVAKPTSPAVMFLLPMTENVRAVSTGGNEIGLVSREWALLDSLASPGRQPDATLYLVDDLIGELTS